MNEYEEAMSEYEEAKTTNFWRRIRAEKGEEGLRLKVQELQEASLYRPKVIKARAEEINEFKELESVDKPIREEDRQAKALQVSEDTLAAVRTGNTIQVWILVVLGLTLLVSITTCRSG